MNKVGRAICGLRFVDANRISAFRGSTCSEICRLAPCITCMVHYLATNAYRSRTNEGNQVAPLTREHPRRRYTPVDYPCIRGNRIPESRYCTCILMYLDYPSCLSPYPTRGRRNLASRTADHTRYREGFSKSQSVTCMSRSPRAHPIALTIPVYTVRHLSSSQRSICVCQV